MGDPCLSQGMRCHSCLFISDSVDIIFRVRNIQIIASITNYFRSLVFLIQKQKQKNKPKTGWIKIKNLKGKNTIALEFKTYSKVFFDRF